MLRGFGDEDEQQRADAVHEQHDGRVDAKEERHQDSGAEHCEQVLDAQRQQHTGGDFFVHLIDFFRHKTSHFLIFRSIIQELGSRINDSP